MKLLLATRNAGKIEEFSRILKELAPFPFELVGLDAFPEAPEVEETGDTFIENALLKAEQMCAFTGLISIADDSGLCVDALNGDPGIFSARWSGVHGDDAANNAKVLAELRDIPEENRAAHFRCATALALPDGTSHCEEAIFEGRILHSPMGDNGFGYDPIFAPKGFSLSSASLSAQEKDAISHRGKALRSLAPHVIVALEKLG